MEFGFDFFPAVSPAEAGAQFFAECLELSPSPTASVTPTSGRGALLRTFRRLQQQPADVSRRGLAAQQPPVTGAGAARVQQPAEAGRWRSPSSTRSSGGRLDIGFAPHLLPHEFARFGV